LTSFLFQLRHENKKKIERNYLKSDNNKLKLHPKYQNLHWIVLKDPKNDRLRVIINEETFWKSLLRLVVYIVLSSLLNSTSFNLSKLLCDFNDKVKNRTNVTFITFTQCH
jgi:hypothetical protein